MNIETVSELIASLESAGEPSIREQKFLKLAKAYQQLAAESVALKAGVAEEIEVINRGGQMYCVKDGMSINPIYARGWNDHRANVTAVQTPATDRIYAGIKADGVEEFAAKLRIPGDDQFFDALAKGIALAADDFAKQLREGADK
ncbi:hypothetical protein QDV37_10870 [Klebsiella pneumoniae]|uniref:hypothetical protein n=1 Tax=Klebsiella pneumoniae TaxID=573 RepID=UPI0013F3AA09|nr:hypothetical protein [Klebsiella pneumoniae]QIJ13581.1 hypothetical protein FDK26_07115 [Klebsiella pneumoniae]QIJ19189.1 hypothetical protein FDK25_07115 [Klebsiella pneumoniae]UGR06632.1 hypothetical protein LRZ80_07040 [Klebsiella pneumoniae]WGH98949.1 hypothetical protein QDV37_10870 [Klebsiella pneumoniae]WKH93082.1 hypothetical protein QYQ81_07210 [Klebsiella pneumoniae]